MEESFIRQRITQLRIQKNVSEYKMSMDLGHSKGYIQSITSGRALPSMSEFLTICDYFGITPLEFFDTNENEVIMLKELDKEVSKMNKEDICLLIQIAKRLNQWIRGRLTSVRQPLIFGGGSGIEPYRFIFISSFGFYAYTNTSYPVAGFPP